ncbi:energy transducer TonB [Orrella sp. NBD-18]|uniref:Protein TonB n=1 Tax=Sheuella amnicola TaxID=2707330 RepID=A0A6B2QUV9_9BURK|nr:energy transducer TonB [Sheuella amnicola]NDY81693.1 energy transducer TonB [Sheuella amnicola]
MDSRPSGIASRLRRLPILIFLIVLLVHVAVGAWVLSARFGQNSEVAESPIFVTLEKGESDEDGSEQAQSSDSVDSGETPQSKSHTTQTPAEPTPKDLSSAKENPSEISNRIKQSEPSSRPSAEYKHKPASIAPALTTQPTSDTIGSSSPTNVEITISGESGSVGHSSGLGSPSTGPRHVSHIDYLGSAPSPVYPARAKSRQQEGRVVVRVLVDSSGQIRSLSVLKSSGYDTLDKSALDAVAKTRFKPHVENGTPMDRLADIPIDFVLNR